MYQEIGYHETCDFCMMSDQTVAVGRTIGLDMSPAVSKICEDCAKNAAAAIKNA